jgi:hypothetical protein
MTAPGDCIAVPLTTFANLTNGYWLKTVSTRSARGMSMNVSVCDRALRALRLGALLAFGVAGGFIVPSVAGAGASPAVTTPTLYVSSTGSNTGNCPSTNPCATVSYALTKASSGAVIKVSGKIDDNVTIKSPVTITNWTGRPDGPAVLYGTASESYVVYNSAVGVTLNDGNGQRWGFCYFQRCGHHDHHGQHHLRQPQVIRYFQRRWHDDRRR